MLSEGMLSISVSVCVEISDDCIVLIQGVANAFTESILTCCDMCNKLDNAHHGTL